MHSYSSLGFANNFCSIAVSVILGSSFGFVWCNYEKKKKIVCCGNESFSQKKMLTANVIFVVCCVLVVFFLKGDFS